MNAPDRDPTPSAEHRLPGIDGGNPLAFLAALGTIRALASAWPDRRIRMSWSRAGRWQPALHLDHPATRAEILAALDTRLHRMRDHPVWSLGPDLTVSPEEFRDRSARPAAREARHPESPDRTWADFAAAFGSEATTTLDASKKTLIQDTALRTMSGSGHQHFLQFMRNIVERTTPEHIEKTLFEPWRYDDPVENQTLRWDPIDDVHRALRWRDPSGDPRRRHRGGMLGANRLAIEGLPLLPTIPAGSELRTTGFRTRRGEGTSWTWPIWSGKLTIDVIRSTLALGPLQHSPDSASLRALGIVEVYRSRRQTRDKKRSFSPAQPL